MSKLQERQAEFLRVLAETGSPVQARRAVGVGSRAVRKWSEDEAFLEAYNEAIEVAQDAIRAKVREMALAGSEPMLALSMKVIEPALQPKGSQVAVGVQLNGAGAGDEFARKRARLRAMSDAELLAELRRFQADLEMRLPEAIVDVVDVEAIEGPGAGQLPDAAAPGGSGEAEGPSAEDLI